jgi:hypothetical protein
LRSKERTQWRPRRNPRRRDRACRGSPLRTCRRRSLGFSAMGDHARTGRATVRCWPERWTGCRPSGPGRRKLVAVGTMWERATASLGEVVRDQVRAPRERFTRANGRAKALAERFKRANGRAKALAERFTRANGRARALAERCTRANGRAKALAERFTPANGRAKALAERFRPAPRRKLGIGNAPGGAWLRSLSTACTSRSRTKPRELSTRASRQSTSGACAGVSTEADSPFERVSDSITHRASRCYAGSAA